MSDAPPKDDTTNLLLRRESLTRASSLPELLDSDGSNIDSMEAQNCTELVTDDPDLLTYLTQNDSYTSSSSAADSSCSFRTDPPNESPESAESPPSSTLSADAAIDKISESMANIKSTLDIKNTDMHVLMSTLSHIINLKAFLVEEVALLNKFDGLKPADMNSNYLENRVWNPSPSPFGPTPESKVVQIWA